MDFLKISAETKPGSSKSKFSFPSCLVPSSKVTDSAEVPWNLLRLLRRIEIFSASFSFESTNSVSTSVTTLAKVLARVSTLYSFLVQYLQLFEPVLFVGMTFQLNRMPHQSFSKCPFHRPIDRFHHGNSIESSIRIFS